MNKFLSLILVMSCACSSASSPKEDTKPESTSSGSSSGSGSGSSTSLVVDSGGDTTSSTSTSSSSSGSGSGSSSVTPPVVDAGHDAGHVVEVDAGKPKDEDAGHDAGSCALPSGTYTYVFTDVTANCDNTLATYMVGPVPLGSVDLGTLLPSFCDAAGDTSVVSAATDSSNGCSASATITCSDPVPATLPDGGSDPLTIVSVSTITSNATATVLTGTLSLTTTDEVSKASCTQTYTWKATTTE